MNKEEQLSPEKIEIQLLFEAVFQRYGYDFREYGKAHAKRRVLHRLALSGLQSISELQNKILYDEKFFQIFLQDLSINTTEMFRDPAFFLAIRKQIIPILKTFPFLKIWHAGCSTGEEVYSMAILLEEKGLYKRTQIYATDFNQNILVRAKEAIYPAENMKDFTRNYIKA
jgi:chemotaxis protein methyltransferase CheR